MKKRYFRDYLCDKVESERVVLLSNKVSGQWIKIPTECYDILNYASENRIALEDVAMKFMVDEDRRYYLKLIELLEKIGLAGVDYDIESLGLYKVVFSITNRCNLSCEYCCAESELQANEYLTTSDCKNIIDRIVLMNPDIVIISGGEPMMRNDIFDILNYLKQKFSGKIILSTNATLIKDNDAEILAKILHAIEISVDGYDDKTVSRIRGCGVYDKVVAVVKKLQMCGLEKISLSMVLGKDNINQKKNFIEFCDEMNVSYMLRYFYNVGRGKNNHERYVENLLDINYIDFEYEKSNTSFTTNRCKAGLTQISIDRKGDVYPCPNLEYEEFKMYNILDYEANLNRKYNLRRELEQLKKINNFKTTNIEKCKSCNINVFCMPCPAMIYNIIDDDIRFEHNCKRNKYMQLKIWS